jgi:EmrB/QacA subfamily drug resistance transporter
VDAKRNLVFLAALLATFMASVEATIIATAMPTIVGDLGGLRLFSWVFGAYFLTQGVTIPIYGRLADLFGRKVLLVVAIAIFLTGSVLCGFAHDMVALIAFRALQGIGAGGVQPIATTIVGDLFPGRERARALGYLSSVWGTAAVVGPLLGAFLVQHVGWPAVFWLNVPFGAVCVVLVLRFLHENVERHEHHIDYLGSALLALGIGTLMYALVMSGGLPPLDLGLLGAAALVTLALLLAHEARALEPMVPLKLYRIRVIAVASAGNFAIGAMVMGISAFLPTYVQGAMGRSAVLAGTVLSAMLVSWTVGSMTGARLMLRTSYRLTALVGSLAALSGSAFLVTLTPERGLVWANGGVALLGLGFGFVNSVFIIATQSAVGWEQRGSATASNVFMRQLGQAIGTATFGAVFNLGVYARIPDAGAVVGRLMDPAQRAHFAPLELARDTRAVALALHPVYLMLAAIACALLLASGAIPAKLRPGHPPADARP